MRRKADWPSRPIGVVLVAEATKIQQNEWVHKPHNI
jgi:hypothetical protein